MFKHNLIYAAAISIELMMFKHNVALHVYHKRDNFAAAQSIMFKHNLIFAKA